MKRGKREMRRNYKGKTALVALVLIFCCTVGGTLAWLATSTEDVVNTFTPGEVDSEVYEEVANGVKSNVRIKNTGNVDAYIRAAIVVNWVDKDGNVYGETPGSDDYELVMSDYWKRGNDGFYYYPDRVGAKQLTSDQHYLIVRCKPDPGKAPVGCNLQVTILADAIQADGVDSTGKPAVEIAWPNVTVQADKTLSVS